MDAFKNIANFSNTSDYLPILNAVIITDLFVISLLNAGWIRSRTLRQWYERFGLSAVIADVLVIVLALIITRALYFFVFQKFSIVQFAILAVIVQVIHDISFFVFFSAMPKGTNRMLDFFKEYAKESSYGAILSDSGMMVMSSFLASFLASQNLNTNIIVLVSFVYLLPYLLFA